MVAWDIIPHRNGRNLFQILLLLKKTNMDSGRISLEGIIHLVEDSYLPNSHGLGSFEDMNVFYDDVNSSIVPSESPSNYEETRSKSFKGISSDTQFEDAIINKGVTYDVSHTRIPRDDDDDDDDDRDDDDDDDDDDGDDDCDDDGDDDDNQSTGVARRRRAPAKVTVPDKVEVKVCDLVVQRAARDNDNGEDDEVFVPESSKMFGTPIVYSYQEFGTTKTVGNVVYALWQQYDNDTRGNIGQKSPLYLKTNRQGKGKMTKIVTTLQLYEETEILLKRARKQLVIERDGDDVFCIELPLGLRGATSAVMEQGFISDPKQQENLTQTSFELPAKEGDRGGGSRRDRRGASRSLNASALSMFKKYYLDNTTDNPYYHALCHEH